MTEVEPIQCPDCGSTWLPSSEAAICIELYGGCFVCKRNELPKDAVDRVQKLRRERFSKLVEIRDQSAIIDGIEAIRERNNANWMDLVRLALRVAPKETKAIMKNILQGDKSIQILMEELVKK